MPAGLPPRPISEEAAMQWLHQEYDHLLEHYKQDDDWAFRATGVMTTTHGAGLLFAFTSESFRSSGWFPALVLGSFGLVLSIAWGFLHFRLMAYRDVHDQRIADIETYLRDRWPVGFGLSPRTTSDWSRRLEQQSTYLARVQLRARVVLLLLPTMAGMAWLLLPIWAAAS